MKHLEKSKFRVLAAVEDGTISVETYLTSTATLSGEEKVALVEWMGEKDIDIRPNLSMQALYHGQQNRKYRPTRREKESGRFECPACRVFLVRVTRKALDPLFRCTDCGWAIAQSDIWDPQMGGEPELRQEDYPEGIAPPPDESEGPW